ncbi:hypothetical protein NP233_g2684 [Leucocoprinus birnbaumii]|uniref:Uncharacterized protein n=1 Tax=Leucocoprinus birnbaumii TaxID=56174 RepID=A0AAD5VZX2_9AGAR|nr:hypothetical protein NP233_g2684 [Leucocoprinus birnbaumii]
MAHVDYPYGKKRNWEFETADVDVGLKSVADSLVLKHSLRQSRDQWLYHTFRKFTSKARGAKAPEPPPPHTIVPRGKCDLVVGPHQFRQTTFYEVHYMQPATPVQTYQSSTNLYPSYAANGTQQQVAGTSTSVATPAPASTPSGPSDDLRLTLGEGLEYTISSDLVARIHHEASVNPIFAAKFRLAVDPNATPEQIRNFAFALPHLPGVKVSGAPTSLTLSTTEQQQQQQQQQVRLPPVREWDFVIEYNETPNERWLIPRGTLASCSRLLSKDGSGLSEVTLNLRLPIPQPPQPDGTTPPEPLVRYKSSKIWDEKNMENAGALGKIPKRQKVFLARHIPQGALLTQLQAAQTPGYTVRPLKQGPSNPPRPRRKPAQKPKPKPTPQEPLTTAAGTPTETINGVATSVTTSVTPTLQPPKPAKPPKEPKRTETSTTDVPLMKGGRFCRECVEAGKADDAIPQLPPKHTLPYSSTTYSYAAARPAAVYSVQNHVPSATVAAIPTAVSVEKSVTPTTQSSTPSQDTSAPQNTTAQTSSATPTST